MNELIGGAEAQEIALHFPVPDATGQRACMRRHVQAILSLAVEWGMDEQAARDWMAHYEDRLGVMRDVEGEA